MSQEHVFNAAHVATVLSDANGDWHDGVEAHVSILRTLDSAELVNLQVTLDNGGAAERFVVHIARMGN